MAIGPALLGHTGWRLAKAELVDLNTVGLFGVIALVGVTGMSLNLTTPRPSTCYRAPSNRIVGAAIPEPQ